MPDITFDYNKLNKNDRRYYDAMTDYEKQNFERIWVSIETQKARLIQQKNACRERANREHKALAEKERRERNHRLIERGAILESCIKDPQAFTNEQIKEILVTVFKVDAVKQIVEGMR